MALRADLGIYKEAVEQSEASCQRVMVRSGEDVGEVDEAGVSVGILQVTEHLIVGAILFDDVDDMLERRIAARRWLALPVICGRDALGEGGQLGRCHA